MSARAPSSALQASARLTIDLDAIRQNYRTLASLASGAECAGVVKANAYGTGAEVVAPQLAAEGCRTFFVATVDEALRLRTVLEQADIYVLDGLPPGCGPLFTDRNLRPVLGSPPEIEEWASHCQNAGARLPAAVHIDTGMNRLGLSAREVADLGETQSLFDDFQLSLVITHLACADDPEDPMTERQRVSFDALCQRLPSAPASLANSAGIMAGELYHYDMVRAGVALYGGHARAGHEDLMKPVVRLEGRIAQIRQVEPGETIGYGATFRAEKPMRVATVTLGYADGFFRLLSASNIEEGATAFIGETAAPLVGRVSMDLITLDVSQVPEHRAVRGALVEFIGPHVGVDDVARLAQTIGYEVLTSLGTRSERIYVGGE